MLRNYLKIAVRNLLRNKAFSAINIAGLAIGMASALLILLWIKNQLTYDRWYPKTERLYEIYNRDMLGGTLSAWPSNPIPLGTALKKDYSAVEDVSRYNNINFLLSVNETHLNTRGAFVDSGFVHLFDFPTVSGDPARMLDAPRDIVLTQHMAIALFGSQDPMGKTVRIDSNAVFTVTGVLKDLPPNTSFAFDYLLPWSFMTRLGWDDQNWGRNGVWTFVLLKPGASQTAFDNQIQNIIIDHSSHKETTHVFTQPMSRHYLYSRSENGQLVGDRIRIVQLFIVIAAFILLIACINFMNLSTARSERRAREVGIRKVVGAVKGSLVGQFIGESILIAFLSFGVALLITSLSLDSFNELVGKQLTINYADPAMWIFAIAFVLFTGLLAGSYPAFYLSSFQPVKVLKGTFKKVNALVSTRKALVILQFTFAIVLIISTLLIRRQIQYAQDRDSGYDRKNLVYTFTQGDFPKHYQSIKADLLSGGAAVSVTESLNPITTHWSDGWGWSWTGSSAADKRIDFTYLGSDANFTKTMGATLVAGRDIDVYQYPTDTMACLLNETAVKMMNIKDPIGLTMVNQEDHMTVHVVGIIKDFILESPYTKIGPMLIEGPRDFFQVMNVKLNPARPVSDDLAQAQQILRKYNPQYPPDFVFADEFYARKFYEEQQIGRLAALFAGLTIFISCLGLFALATYMAENRIREIGVRKVLGASVTGLATLLAKDFVWLVLTSFVIAAPIAWYGMHEWLKGYEYRVPIGWEVFALSGGLALIIGIATVSYQAVRAAMTNPAKSLRRE